MAATAQINWLDMLSQPPRTTPKQKHFYRCVDCLTVMVTDELLKREVYDRETHREHIGQCGACGGWIEYLGRVERNTLVRTVDLCPCDGRCTGAAGPSCDCQCGGENHGKGRMVQVDRSGPMPRFMAHPDAKGKADAYIAVCDAYESAWDAKYGDVVERKRNGYIRDFGFYLEAMDEWTTYSKACRLKTHKTRNARIAELTERIRRTTKTAD